MSRRDYLAAVHKQAIEHRARLRSVDRSSARLTRLMAEARAAGYSLRQIGDVAYMSNIAVLKRTGGGE